VYRYSDACIRSSLVLGTDHFWLLFPNPDFVLASFDYAIDGLMKALDILNPSLFFSLSFF
jgi:hypothetical protein